MDIWDFTLSEEDKGGGDCRFGYQTQRNCEPLCPCFCKNAARHEDTWVSKKIYTKPAGAVNAAGFVFSEVWPLYRGMEKAVAAGKVEYPILSDLTENIPVEGEREYHGFYILGKSHIRI